MFRYSEFGWKVFREQLQIWIFVVVLYRQIALGIVTTVWQSKAPSQELRGGTVGALGRPCDIARPCPWARERPTQVLRKEIPHQVGNDKEEVLKNNAKQACYALRMPLDEKNLGLTYFFGFPIGNLPSKPIPI
jgi:hypothetical protein